MVVCISMLVVSAPSRLLHQAVNHLDAAQLKSLSASAGAEVLCVSRGSLPAALPLTFKAFISRVAVVENVKE
jgi:hypothetical protein